MMWWTLLFFIPLTFAQTPGDLSAIQKLDEELPNYNDYKESPEEALIKRQNRRFRPPVRMVKKEQIINSGTETVALTAGTLLRNLESNRNYKIPQLTYVKVYKLPDEHGFKYLQSKNGPTNWRVRVEKIVPIREELALYEPPLTFTPAPDNIVRAEYDTKLSLLPEFSFYAGFVNGDFMADLLNDQTARSGRSTQYGVHLFTEWKLPVKVGAALHYERSFYQLKNGAQLIYNSVSFGPQLKSKDFELFNQPVRVQTQFRVSPFARLSAENSNNEGNFKFNSYDLLISMERPIKNQWGEFVLGLYFQNQWLNLKDQPEEVDIKATNETNKSFGISLSQVF